MHTDFAPYPWQEASWKRLLELVRSNRLPHALLLSGQSGLGQLDFAKVLIQLLLCEHPTQRACGCCSACQWMSAETHPDLIWIQPEKTGTQIKIDQIRNMIPFLSQSALKRGRKVIIIESAELLNAAAANALLKQLEEPHADTVFILVSERESTLLPTVMSRCQRIRFSVVRTEALDQWLMKRVPVLKHASLDHLWRCYQTPFNIVTALENGQEDRRQKFLTVLAGSVMPVALLSRLEEIVPEELLGWMMSVVGDCIRMKLQQSPQFIDRVLAKKLESVIEKTSIDRYYQVLAIYKQHRQDLDRVVSLNATLLMLSIMIPWSRLYR